MEFQKNMVIELEIIDLSAEGEGIGKVDGFPFFVKGVIPGDVIEALVMKVKKNMGYARVQKIIVESPDRIAPACEVFGRCGGCQLLHMTYDAQLRYKNCKIRSSLIRIGGVDASHLERIFEPIIAMEKEAAEQDVEDEKAPESKEKDAADIMTSPELPKIQEYLLTEKDDDIIVVNPEPDNEADRMRKELLAALEKQLAERETENQGPDGEREAEISKEEPDPENRIHEEQFDNECSGEKLRMPIDEDAAEMLRALGNITPQQVLSLCRKDASILSLLARNFGGQRESVYSTPMRYRNKAQYPCGTDQKGNIVFGFYASHSHRIIPHKDCLLENEGDGKILDIIKGWMMSCDIQPYNEEEGKGFLRHVLIRRGYYTGEVMVCLVINSRSFPRKRKEDVLLCDALMEIEGIHSICYSVNCEQTNVIMGDSYEVLWGEGYIRDSISSNIFRISPLSFYQVNPIQTEKLYFQALSYAELTGGEVVWDLYCGIGTISLFLAKSAGFVYGVEIVPQAIEDARENARLNSIQNVEFICGAAEDVVDRLPRPEVIVVDPPRKGCDEKCLEIIVENEPDRIVYISCNPATLARDIAFLRKNNYEPQRVRGCDMFPGGYHVETVVSLSKVTGKPEKLSVQMNAEETGKTLPQEDITYNGIRELGIET